MFKAASISALLNAFLMAIQIAVGTLSGNTMTRVSALAVSGFVTIAKETLFRYLHAAGRRSGSAILQASAWHARMDAVSALVATLGVAGSMAGLPMLDHVAAAAIGLMIMRMGYLSARDAFKQLSAGAAEKAVALRTAE
ncbi:cation transporter [Paraburkholderia fungorum]|uniref:cation transporter n=1 Tax=Paraburkholderia fungorum TaxID=134537 RepID=UPI0038B84B45